MLASHPDRPLEYWFFKVNAGSVALLVDWIVRRKQAAHLVRVSLHSPQQRAVLFDKLPAPMIPGENYLTTERTAGRVGDISWALDIECADERIQPDVFPARLLRMTDVVLDSAPRAAFTGWIRHGELQVEVRAARGMLAHYWGRQLPHEWWWVSANQFDRDDLAVECAVLRSAVWGMPIRLPLAYLYVGRPATRRLLMAPPARAHVKGTPEAFEIRFQPLAARPITLRARGRDYGDLGDGIANTLVGDLDLWEGDRLIARAEGTAALERRAPPLRPV